jgi:hypothetical protein
MTHEIVVTSVGGGGAGAFRIASLGLLGVVWRVESQWHCVQELPKFTAPQNYWIDGSAAALLFHNAETELASVNSDATLSALHVIVIDEIDVLFRKRSSAEDSGEATRSSTVSQVLES